MPALSPVFSLANTAARKDRPGGPLTAITWVTRTIFVAISGGWAMMRSHVFYGIVLCPN